MLTSFVPIRINEKNFKEYLDDYVNVLVNPYETDEKKNQVKDALISNFALSKYADIIDKVLDTSTVSTAAVGPVDSIKKLF